MIVDAKHLLNAEKLPPLQKVSLATVEKTKIVFNTDHGKLSIASWNSEIFRFTLGEVPTNDYEMLAENSYFPVEIELIQNQNNFEINMQNQKIIIENNPFRFSFYSDGKKILQPETDSFFTRRYRHPPFAKVDNGWIFGFDLSPETNVYGFGEMHGSINQKGNLIRSYIEDSLGVNSEHMYKNTPFFWSNDGWGIVIHTPAPIHHSVGWGQLSYRTYLAEIEDNSLDLFLFSGNGKQIINNFTNLTGKPALSPDWALGFWTSRAYYKTEEELLEAANTMREKALPCDVITIDGRAWQDTDTRMSFDWDPTRYPNPQASIKRILDLGYEIACWIYPYMSVNNAKYQEFCEKGWFLKTQDGKPYEFEWDMSPFGEVLTPLPKSAIYDFTNPEVVEWWKEEVRNMARMGVKCLKTDFAEQVPDDAVAFNGDSGRRYHNVFTFTYTKITYEALCEVLGVEKAMIWDRSSWLGSHRFPMQWCGDSQSDWGGMAHSIISNLNYGLSGGAYYTYDIGGFYGEQPSPELFVRWTQCAVFTSHCRFHGIGEREPYYYGDEALNIVRDWINLRYQLIPYVKKSANQANQKGTPLCRAMVLEYPSEKHIHNYEMQYMFGDDIFVAPIIKEGGEVSYYLPKGNWYNFFTNEKIAGNQAITEILELEQIPVFVKDGAIIPVGQQVKENTQEYKNYATCGLKIYGNPIGEEVGENYTIKRVDNKLQIQLTEISKDNIELIDCDLEIEYV